MIAERLVNELMLVSVLVAGEGAGAFAAALAAAGAAAESLDTADPPEGFDLVVLLAAPDGAGRAETAKLVASLAGASDRLLFAPLPLRDSAAPSDSPALPELNDWFEVFAEHGYQPVVDFDADFVAAGAFLVDRAATAAESELAAFTDRLQNLAVAPAREPSPPGPSAGAAETASLRAEIAALEVRLTSLTEEAAQSAAALHEAEARGAGWDALLAWVNHIVADPTRDNEAALRRDLPRIQVLRGPEASPILLTLPAHEEGLPPARPGWLARLFRRPQKIVETPPTSILEDTALVRASKSFDAAWYIASTPELIEGEPIDPVFHYVMVGGPRGADPGPWFDTAAYLAAHPDAVKSGVCPLVHAIRSGAADRMGEA